MAIMVSLRPCLLFILLCIAIIKHAHSNSDRKTYIVYMGDHPKDMDFTSVPSLHTTMAQKVLGSDFKSEAVLHSYKNFNAFVMKLTEEEAKRMAEMEKVISVFPNAKNGLHTTRSWNFLEFAQNVNRATTESDIIVGVIDSGIWPESESFSDKGFGPPPTKWKGSCHNFTCNNKIIGAKYFNLEHEFAKDDILSPRDAEGHGSHCASTVAGNSVNSASLFGLAAGTARGGVPSARIAVYKVCWKTGKCGDADTLAAFDEAISDGVDFISISIGVTNIVHIPYFQESNNIGSFHAMKKGILTSNSGNNLGPSLSSMTNYPPWLLSVAASTFDRKIMTKVKLGNGAVYEGVSINTFDLKRKLYPLVYGGNIPNIAGGHNSSTSRYCLKDSLDQHSVKGKIVLCERIQSSQDVGFLSGAVGLIFGNNNPKDLPRVYALPALEVTQWNQRLIYSYIASTRNATATIFKSEEVKDGLVPFIASFSSRGPNPITPNTLKPDLAAPGVEVIAAWSPIDPISGVKGDKRKVEYNVISGTSMACPHATAAAVYVKSFHPNWSPAMIKSALMTTATPMSRTLNPEAEFAYGAGLINPVKASNPGLVYDISEADYLKFLCGEGYTDKELRVLGEDHSSCKGQANEKAVYELNLPSFSLFVNDSDFSRAYRRTVTNVGSATSTYKARVIASSLLNIQVKPSTLSFTSIGQKKSFYVIIEGRINVEILSASVIWDDGNHQVRSPIVVWGVFEINDDES